MSDSFYWFDFETFGVNPAQDRPSQFAGIRTDLEFNLIDEPLNIFCKPANDFLPHPEACLITGITPQQALENGVPEKEFFRRIHLELSTAKTCAVGYNNIRFDDEVVRFGLYRNFYDPYTREWQNGNSRWDIHDMMRMTYALRPEGINWPLNEAGKPSFKLEQLSAANGIAHENAHDALSDVYATIEMAKLIKTKQPRLFEYLFGLRDKRQVMAEIDLINHTPFIHCSGMLGPSNDYCGVMLPLVAHPTNKNSAICINITHSLPEDIAELSEAEIEQRIFSKQQDLGDDIQRLPIKEIHYNKCPAVAPLGVLNQLSQQRLKIDLASCLTRAQELKKNISRIKGRLLNVFQNHQFKIITDPDLALYSGGFFQPHDKNLMQKIQMMDWQELATTQFNFKDPRLPTMLHRYRARNALDTLNQAELEHWNEYRKQNLLEPNSGSSLIYPDFIQKIESLLQDKSNDAQLLQQVKKYGESLVSDLT
ncbi:exodeoxyribonuclease I [Aliikangiella sp. IMCC44653]